MNKMLSCYDSCLLSYSACADEDEAIVCEDGGAIRGRVTVKVSLEGKGDTITVKVMNTHTVALDQYKFDEIVALKAGGKEYKPKLISQAGSGHHRSAVVEFDNIGTKEIEVVVKGVAGVKERVFKF
jgi:hypothetical protein